MMVGYARCFSAKTSLLAFAATTLAACANDAPVAIYDRFSAGVTVQATAGTNPTPAEVSLAIKRELYVYAPQKSGGYNASQTDAKSAIVVFENSVENNGYTLTHGFATGRAARNISTNPTSVAKLAGTLESLEYLSPPEIDSRIDAGECIDGYYDPDEAERIARRLGWNEDSVFGAEDFLGSLLDSPGEYSIEDIQRACSN
ncbi:hypothetical protein WNY37_03585 [Henriciella sp. AS95]|uniref:hypothetical protein n=1 Tax=Henriciella sp. AS95 TaxID=3135782 RepID=UPI0031731EC1